LQPDLRVKPVVVAGYHQPRHAAQAFETLHLVLVQHDRAVDDEDAVAQPCHGHAALKIADGHVDLPHHRPHVVVDGRQRAVRQDFPGFERGGHRRLRLGCAKGAKEERAPTMPEDPHRRQTSCLAVKRPCRWLDSSRSGRPIGPS
jgi:hypothetical protein